MLKAIVLATAIVTLAGSAQASDFKGSYWRQSSYSSRAEEHKLVRIANRQRLEKTTADIAALNAGQQQAGAKYDAAMNSAYTDLKRGVTGTVCSTCR